MQYGYLISFCLITIGMLLIYRFVLNRYKEGYYQFKEQALKKSLAICVIIGIILFAFCLVERSRKEYNKGFENEITNRFINEWIQIEYLTQNTISEIEASNDVLDVVEGYIEDYERLAYTYSEYLVIENIDVGSFFSNLARFMNDKIIKVNDDATRNDNLELFEELVKDLQILSDTIAYIDINKRSNILWENTKEGKEVREEIDVFIDKYQNTLN